MLVEAMVAIGVAITILVAIVSLSRRSVSNSGQASRQSLATNYASEMVDWLKKESKDWEIFKTKASVLGTVYCFNTTSWPGASGGCAAGLTIGGTEFVREVTLVDATATVDRITAKVEIKWQEGSRQEVVVQTAEYYAY